jgi:hypothetical protein
MFTDILTADDLNAKFTSFLTNLKTDVGLSYFIRVLQQARRTISVEKLSYPSADQC